MSMPHGKDGVGSEDFGGSDYPDLDYRDLEERVADLEEELEATLDYRRVRDDLVPAVQEFLDWYDSQPHDLPADVIATVERALIDRLRLNVRGL